MTGYRRAYGRSRMPRRYVLCSAKVFYLEQSKRKVQVEAKWHERFSSESRMNLRYPCQYTTRNCFSRSIRRVPKGDSGDGMLFNSIKGVLWERQLGVEREVVNRVQLDLQAAVPRRDAPHPTVGEQLSRRVYIRRSVESARYGYTDRCIGCQQARLGLKLADHSEECLPGLSGTGPVMMTSIREYKLRKTKLSKLHHLRRELESETLCQNRQERKSDSRNELKHNHLRVLFLQIHGAPAAVRAAVPVPVPIPTAVQPRLPHRCRLTKAIRTAQKRQKVTDGADMELEGLVLESELNRLERNSD